MIVTFGDKKSIGNFISGLHDFDDDEYFCFIYHKDEIRRKVKGKKKLVLVWKLRYITQYLKKRSKK